jgi:hypothetical protein
MQIHSSNPGVILMSATSLAATIEFTALRIEAEKLLRRAAALEALPALLKAQATAAAGLAGTRLHQVHGQAGADDARAMVGDLDALCTIVDPLVWAIGAEAASEFHGVDRALFKDQLRDALDGNAMHTIERAAEIATEDREMERV